MRCVGGKKRKYDSSLASMLDRTRVVLCAVMFAVMLFNPFGSLLPAAVPGVANIRSAGRTLLSDDSTTGKLSNSRCCSYLYLLSSTHSHVDGYVMFRLVDFAEVGFLDWFLPNLLFWMSNAVVGAVFLARLFIYSEPVMKSASEQATTFWKHKTQADADAAKVHSLYQ
jgi:hypothetical protein